MLWLIGINWQSKRLIFDTHGEHLYWTAADMPATAALSRLLLNAVRQGINPARSCLLRPNLATSTATPSLASQWRLQSTANAATTDKDLDVHVSGGPKFSHLRDRSVMRVYGTDAADLIQGLVANDVNVLNDEKVMYTMFLSSAVSNEKDWEW